MHVGLIIEAHLLRAKVGGQDDRMNKMKCRTRKAKVEWKKEKDKKTEHRIQEPEYRRAGNQALRL